MTDQDSPSDEFTPTPKALPERSGDVKAIIDALKAANLPLDGALGLALTRIGLVLVHRAGSSRWEVAGETCLDINSFDMRLGDWVYGPWFTIDGEQI
jgi:hypothetical protein